MFQTWQPARQMAAATPESAAMRGEHHGVSWADAVRGRDLTGLSRSAIHSLPFIPLLFVHGTARRLLIYFAAVPINGWNALNTHLAWAEHAPLAR